MVVAVLSMLGIVAIAYLMDVRQSGKLRAEFQTELAATADAAEVARQIVRLDSVNAHQDSVIAETMSSVGALISVTTMLNSRVVKAEETLDKNRRAAAAAASSAKKAREFAQEARDQLARLDAESQAWQASTAGVIAGIPREIDSRVGPVAVDLSAFQKSQAAAHAAQDSVNAVQRTAISAFRAKLRLSDKDVSRLAAELAQREQHKKRRGR